MWPCPAVEAVSGASSNEGRDHGDKDGSRETYLRPVDFSGSSAGGTNPAPVHPDAARLPPEADLSSAAELMGGGGLPGGHARSA